MRAKFVSAKLIELAKRLITFDSSLGVYANGENNDYAERVERIINNSATAKSATNLFRKYIIGKGFTDDINKFIVNYESETTLLKLLCQIANSYAYHKGAFLHVNYNLNYKISSLKVLPFKHCLVGKKDDKDWNGKICVYDNWFKEEGKKYDKKQINAIDCYNPNPKVIKSQIEKAGGIKNYKGQIYFYNPEETIYPLAHLDSVLNDADSEFRAGQFKNISLRKGFFGKKVVITPPMVDGELRKPMSELSEEAQEEKRLAEGERQNFRKQMESFVGSDNVDGMLHLELEFEGDDIDKMMKFIDVNTNINDKLFAHTEQSVSDNILLALGVPKILLKSNETSIFGNSGALIQEAKRFFQQQCEEDMNNIEVEIFEKLFRNFQDFQMPESGMKITPLIDVNNAVNN